MEKKKTYAQKEKALKTTLYSKGGLYKHLQGDHCDMDPKERLWLIVFAKNSAIKDSRVSWDVKYWVWDTQTDSIRVSYEINAYSERDGSGIQFIHLLRSQRLVLCKLYCNTIGIYTFNGEILNEPTLYYDYSLTADKELEVLYLFNNTNNHLLIRNEAGQYAVFNLSQQKYGERHKLQFLSLQLDIDNSYHTIEDFELFVDKKIMFTAVSDNYTRKYTLNKKDYGEHSAFYDMEQCVITPHHTIQIEPEPVVSS